MDNENHFTRFAAADEAIVTMQDLASPVRAFVRERCEIEVDAEIDVDVLYVAYKEWCEQSGHVKSNKAVFGRDLKAAFPSVRKKRPREKDGQSEKDKRDPVYAGIRLRKDDKDDE
jgi:putative DNA primase/helicase